MMRALKKLSNILCPAYDLQINNFRSYCKNLVITETDIIAVLKKQFPNADVVVEDTSGGCGTMFDVFVEAAEFKGLSVMKQHRQVYDVLGEYMKSIHGIHLETKAPKS